MDIEAEDDLKVYTPRELARLLHVADERLYRLIHTGQIGTIKDGKRFYIRRDQALIARSLLNR